MNKPPLITNTPAASIHANESRKDFITRALQARDEARASNTYLPANEVLQRLDQSLARAKEKSRPG